MKDALKILRKLDFSSDLVHFLAQVGTARVKSKLGGLKPSNREGRVFSPLNTILIM